MNLQVGILVVSLVIVHLSAGVTSPLILYYVDEAVSFVREAERLPPVVVALNPSDSGKSGKLSSGEYTMGEVMTISSLS